MLARLAVAASLLVRHAGAYADLVLSDAEEARREAGRRLMAGTLLAAAMIFAIAMACLLVIAVTWDTPARLWTVGGLLGLFCVVALVAYTRWRALRAQGGSLFARTAREWEKDRVLLEQLLGGVAIRSDAGDEH